MKLHTYKQVKKKQKYEIIFLKKDNKTRRKKKHV